MLEFIEKALTIGLSLFGLIISVALLAIMIYISSRH